ncbi:MAG: hypothetical protein DMG13_19555 [Acidobacteria bacterium]|nr:MAG: hypothetical protein DMG13_19555 [Acidobacteriota bacterium]
MANLQARSQSAARKRRCRCRPGALYSLGTMKILLVEDTDDSRVLFRSMLEKLGHDVIEATNGREAVQVAVEQSPDLVLMDLSMPEVDGFQATGALRAIRSFVQMPIIVFSAYSANQYREKALAAGCDLYLQKPVDLDELSTALKKFARAA